MAALYAQLLKDSAGNLRPPPNSFPSTLNDNQYLHQSSSAEKELLNQPRRDYDTTSSDEEDHEFPTVSTSGKIPDGGDTRSKQESNSFCSNDGIGQIGIVQDVSSSAYPSNFEEGSTLLRSSYAHSAEYHSEPFRFSQEPSSPSNSTASLLPVVNNDQTVGSLSFSVLFQARSGSKEAENDVVEAGAESEASDFTSDVDDEPRKTPNDETSEESEDEECEGTSESNKGNANDAQPHEEEDEMSSGREDSDGCNTADKKEYGKECSEKPALATAANPTAMQMDAVNCDDNASSAFGNANAGQRATETQNAVLPALGRHSEGQHVPLTRCDVWGMVAICCILTIALVGYAYSNQATVRVNQKTCDILWVESTRHIYDELNGLRRALMLRSHTLAWTPQAPLFKGRHSAAMAVIPGRSAGQTRLALIGGSEESSLPLNGEVFDPFLNTWTPLSSSLKAARNGGAAYTIRNGSLPLLFFAGGFDGYSAHSHAECISTDGLESCLQQGIIPFFVHPRAHFAFSVLEERYMLAAGGWNGTNVLDSVELVTPKQLDSVAYKLKGSVIATLTAPRAGASGVVVGEHFYVIGGYAKRGVALPTVERVHLVVNSGRVNAEVQNMPALNVPRRGASAVSVGSAIYVIGGHDGKGQALKSVERLDTTACYGDPREAADCRWEVMPIDLPSARGYAASAVVVETSPHNEEKLGKATIYLVGGSPAQGESTNLVEKLTVHF